MSGLVHTPMYFIKSSTFDAARTRHFLYANFLSSLFVDELTQAIFMVLFADVSGHCKLFSISTLQIVPIVLKQ